DQARAASAVRFGSPPRAWGQYQQSNRLLGHFRFTPTRVGTMKRWVPTPARNAVHPHARGDNQIADVCAEYPTGSPPRAWGQFRGHFSPSTRCRFTPTRVGTMTSATTSTP